MHAAVRGMCKEITGTNNSTIRRGNMTSRRGSLATIYTSQCENPFRSAAFVQHGGGREVPHPASPDGSHLLVTWYLTSWTAIVGSRKHDSNAKSVGDRPDVSTRLRPDGSILSLVFNASTESYNARWRMQNEIPDPRAQSARRAECLPFHPDGAM